MPDIKVEIIISSHGNWENKLIIDGKYEEVRDTIQRQIIEFYNKALVSMNKVIEKEKTYHEGVASHTR